MLRSTDRGLKPTSYGLQLLGDFIEKNRFEATRAQLKRLLAREEMFDADLEENGYVAIVFNDRVIGCGFYAKGVVSSRIPKGRSEELMESL
jgi:NOL1/NOP2/fmu family ribosome biogenesis protein